MLRIEPSALTTDMGWGCLVRTAQMMVCHAFVLHFLGRHRVPARMLMRAPRQDTGHDLLALAAELGCGMLVMGCFGHSRFRELCMGGASRTVLAEATLPVLMAH